MWIKGKSPAQLHKFILFYNTRSLFFCSETVASLKAKKAHTHPNCILEFNIWKINDTTETFDHSGINISAMCLK